LKKAINAKNVKIYFMPDLISGRDDTSIQYTKKAKKKKNTHTLVKPSKLGAK